MIDELPVVDDEVIRPAVDELARSLQAVAISPSATRMIAKASRRLATQFVSRRPRVPVNGTLLGGIEFPLEMRLAEPLWLTGRRKRVNRISPSLTFPVTSRQRPFSGPLDLSPACCSSTS
jgi:hypothetical protein